MCRSTSADGTRRRSGRFWLLAAIGVGLHGAAAAQNYPPVVDALIANAKAQVRTIDLATFKAALDNKEAGLIIDVREPAEYAAGHVPSAINLPRGIVDLRIWPMAGFPDKTDLDKKITLYCSTGARDILAAKSLQDLGFRNVSAVDMRIDDWAKAGYPLVKD